MSAIFDRLTTLFQQGHTREFDDLLSDSRFADASRTADAAVLIAVTEQPNPTVLLTQRPRTMRDHPGQVAFPGGKLDHGEDAVQAALREAWEELSIEPEHVRLIGTTDRYQTGTGFDITPVLATVPHDLPIRPDPREVESWFECPLDKLMDASQWSRNSVFWKGAMREYLEMNHDGYRIWGVTAAICWNLSRRVEWLRAQDD
ncbi:MAG: CoA pyrophosphatase [Erythrobacter sp.]|jgi:8-oxo-dGTP pyrophosphatase MutT (NUDIX family)|uniref:CoA pyrophosphatase n=1 Tax=Qipengyuania citrea TaxID=225971 RepID=UPI001A5F5F7A|nr:CoA pyrophosphatase [Qipengyuania citrea]MBL4719117.1 CoA pyrophosphatase [Erythrobacter sp.]MCP2017087.1 8-oxo-dGTP pyrophosphatase MutT (NUDIX family) [Qipengyuania citrea]MDE0901130.1 CoA pyrophosphatase [Erythrobacter sp.]